MNAYVKAAVNRAYAAILTAPNGGQETTLHREAYSIGRLIGPDLSEGEAFAALVSAARAMPIRRRLGSAAARWASEIMEPAP